MFTNYFKIAFRTLLRNPIYSFINIAGLSIGIACSMLILLWVYDELSYDKGLPGYSSIHQVMVNAKTETGTLTRSFLPLPLLDVLAPQDTRIKNSCISVYEPAQLSVGEKKLTMTGLAASPSFLPMFGFSMHAGNTSSALNEMRSIVLTKSVAKSLFGDNDAMNKMVLFRFNSNEELKVTGIVDDLPENSSFHFDFIVPFTYFESTSPWFHNAEGNWDNNAFQIYVQLQANADKLAVDNSIRNLIRKHDTNSTNRELFLYPMSQWRLWNRFENGQVSGGNITYVLLFSGIAIFILIIACINFMNLSTARSEHRAREVGIRKSVGSGRGQLVLQFFGESLILSIIACLLAIILVQITLPWYNLLISKHLAIDFASPLFWAFSVSLIVITGILAGSYPALYLSSFRPAKVLKGRPVIGKSARTPRQVLVTLQFGFAILLMIGTVVVYKQIEYLKNRDLGYDRENLMMIPWSDEIEKNFKVLKQELIHSGAALGVTKSNSPITNIYNSSPLDSWTGKRADQRIEVTNIATEYDYTRTMGIKILEGRDFSEEFASDSDAVVINKAAVKMMGLEHPIGEKIQMWGSYFTVIGVMDDVIMGSASRNVAPLVMTLIPEWCTTITVRLAETQNLQASIGKVGDILKKYNPDYAFEYHFADAEFEIKFGDLNLISNMAGAFAGLALFITALGLFGMAAFTAEQRTREIGIRKVLGASVTSVILLLTRDFSRLVIVAFLISAPLAAWATSQFLAQYELHTDVPFWVYPTTGGFALLITLIIVTTQAFRAATTNPVNSLKD